jgi:hypothetical protein
LFRLAASIAWNKKTKGKKNLTLAPELFSISIDRISSAGERWVSEGPPYNGPK